MKRPTKAQLKIISSHLKHLKSDEEALANIPGNTISKGSVRAFNLKQIDALESVLNYFDCLDKNDV